MTPAQERKFDELSTQVKSIHTLLAGSLDKKGVVHVVSEQQKDISDLKEYKDQDEKYKAKVAGGIFAGIPMFGILIEWVKHKITSS